MFAKLSALALCLTLVSALKISVPPANVKAGTTVDIEISTVGGDPTHVGLKLVQANNPNTIENLGGDVVVARNVPVNIPANTSPGQYFIQANQVDNGQTIPGSNSNAFTVAGAQVAGESVGKTDDRSGRL